MKSAVEYRFSSYIFNNLSDVKIGLVSSLYLEKVIILTIFFYIIYIGLSLVGYVFVHTAFQYIRYG